MFHCRISAGSKFFAEPDVQKVKLLIHELGHCLGLDHTENPSIMSVRPVGGLTWTPDDIMGIQSLYGPPSRLGWHRQLLPMLAR